MSQVVLLDAGVLGLVTNPKRSTESVACTQWLQKLVTMGVRVIVPEIADYEVRRELLRANKKRGVARLDELTQLLRVPSHNNYRSKVICEKISLKT